MKKVKKILSTILATSVLGSFTVLNANAETYKLSEFELIDTGIYFDEHPYFPDYMILKNKEWGGYFAAYYGNDGVVRMNMGSIEFLCYLLDNDEKYNAMSEYLSENYPEYSLIHLSEAGELALKYGLGNYVVDTGKEMSEKEIFELATAIKNDIGYYFEMAIEHDMPDTLDCSGDVNTDFSISISDVVAILANVSDSEANPMDEQSIINGDVHDTGNGLNSSDAFMIQQYVTGVIESL